MMTQANGYGDSAHKNVNWLLDFGTTHHITNDESNVAKNQVSFLSDGSIILGNVSSLLIKSNGSAYI